MKKILEIGGGRTPYLIRYKIPWNAEDYYISIDSSEENIELSRKAFEAHALLGNICPMDPNIILSDASYIDFPNEHVDEVIISNTLSAPIHHAWDRDGNKLKIENKSKKIERKIKEEHDLEDPFYIERKNVLKEALRVLKKGGQLSIYTDLIIYGIHAYERILNELRADASLNYFLDENEASRINIINMQKLNSKEFCCCFRAEVLPRSEVYRFIKN